jgi:hypothetical protein
MEGGEIEGEAGDETNEAMAGTLSDVLTYLSVL